MREPKPADPPMVEHILRHNDRSERRPRPFYLGVRGEEAFAVYHAPAAERARDLAIVFCPPFGWEEVSAHRNLRAWAMELADAGYPTLRLSYPGTGDSAAGPRDPGRLDAWTESVTAAAAWVREASGATSTVAVGLSLGGVLAYRAASAGAALDGLVLWSVPDKAQELIRQMRAFSRLETATAFADLPAPPPLPDGELEAGGFVMTAETTAELSRLQLAALPAPAGLRLGALLLGRDEIKMGEGIGSALTAAGVDVRWERGAGYADLTSHPQLTQLPRESMDAISGWLQTVSAPAPAVAPAPAADGAQALEISLPAGVVIERPVELSGPSGYASGILAEPRAGGEDVCAVFLNAGAIRRVGPSRLWVDLARRWGAQGITSVRFDVEGIGEADGPVAPFRDAPSLYTPELVSQVVDTLDQLQAAGVARRFILVGMCAGAYWSFHAALADERVEAIWLLNPAALVWGDEVSTMREIRHASISSLTRLGRKETRDRLWRVSKWLVRRALFKLKWWRRPTEGSEPSVAEQIDAVLEELHRCNTRALLVFAADEPLEEELDRSGQKARMEAWPHVSFEQIAVHSHTLHPHWAQEQAIACLDRALQRELRVRRAGSAPAA